MRFIKSKIQKIFKELFKLNLISKDMKIDNFEDFFDHLDHKFQEIESPNTIISNLDFAKGISFELISNSIIENTAIKFDSNGGKMANVIKLSTKSFGHTWSFGFTKKQNFSFTIYFNKDDIISKNEEEVIIENNYNQEYIQEMAAASPTMAELALREEVVRISGYLNSNKIKAIGFRYRVENDPYEFKYYLLSWRVVTKVNLYKYLNINIFYGFRTNNFFSKF